MAGKNSIRPWIASLLTTEIAAVYAWQDNGRRSRPSDSRFSFDGTAFKSEVQRSQVEEDYRAQLIKVVSATAPVKIMVSDGDASITAVLSPEAVKQLEEGLDEEVSQNIKNDIISVRNLSVISRIDGPSEDRFQIRIETLKYRKLVRATVGSPRHIHEFSFTQGLLRLVKAARNGAERETQPAARTGKRSKRDAEGSSQERQSPLKKQKLDLSSDSSGVEMIEPLTKKPTSGNLSEASRLRATPQATPQRQKVDQPRSSTRTSPVAAEKAARKKRPQLPTRDDDPLRTSPQKADRSSAAVPLSTTIEHPSGRQLELRYARQKIPENQKALLEKPASWYPPGAGRQFPMPNVPLEVLERFKNPAPSQAEELNPVPISQLEDDISGKSNLSWSPTGRSPKSANDLPPDSTASTPAAPRKNGVTPEGSPRFVSPGGTQESNGMGAMVPREFKPPQSAQNQQADGIIEQSKRVAPSRNAFAAAAKPASPNLHVLDWLEGFG
ncbi:hypothetical protein K470DRAFT_255111 [Piedraia hortae CBS 480.64]|uniref:Shelterin complex subunit TPP1/Est3 domain-containing protein n=1 Tax=Piedraia hortae CBS 480.64 TaxID=1314780 RepID=A0A6A7C846_9PEZI|nr:hypothetical protein K470DRAFT_255111 [Piedraia hortae CBS 480.64]